MKSQPNIEIRRLSTCSFADAQTAWNEGFRGYFVDLTLSLDAYVARLHSEALSPEYSFMAFCNEQPVGFLLTGLRTIAGRRVAWNGGTGVSPAFRGKGIGKALLSATIDLYGELGVEVATLEAISDNESAISLYRKFGYDIIDRLIFQRHEGPLASPSFTGRHSASYSVSPVAPRVVGGLSFYPSFVPWQGQWQSITRNHGTALIVANSEGVAVGYALYKQKSDDEVKLSDIILYQCVVDPGSPDPQAVVRVALQYLFAPLDGGCRRTTHNLGAASQTAVEELRESGFRSVIEQVHMVRMSARS